MSGELLEFNRHQQEFKKNTCPWNRRSRIEARGMITFRIGEGKEKPVIDPEEFSYFFKKMVGGRVNKNPSLYSTETKSGQWTKMNT